MSKTNSDVPLEVFQKACIRYAHRYQLSVADDWPGLSPLLQEMFEGMRYIDVIRPFVCDDRFFRGMSWAQLNIKYQIPVSTIWRMAGCCGCKSPSENGKGNGVHPSI